MDILQRVRIRITDPNVSDELLNEYIQTIMDRLCLRLGAETLPAAFDSVCVDAVVKMVRRTYYEGISSESAANLSTSFVEDILSEYDREISDWKNNRDDTDGNNKAVHFL